MNFILISVALIIIGVTCGVLMKLHKNDSHISWECKAYTETIGVSCMIIGLAGLITCMVFMFANNISVNKKIYDAQLERESIVQQLECIKGNYEDVSKIDVIDKVYSWNKKVHSAKYWSQNPWTNWFWSKEYVHSLKYIDMGD